MSWPVMSGGNWFVTLASVGLPAMLGLLVGLQIGRVVAGGLAGVAAGCVIGGLFVRVRLHPHPDERIVDE